MISHRIAHELVYQLERAGERERLARTLATIPVFLTLWQKGSQEQVLQLWSQSELSAITAAYRVGLELWPHSEIRVVALEAVADLFQHIAAWDHTEELLLERLDHVRQGRDSHAEARTLALLSELARLQGRIEEAEHRAQHAEEFARTVDSPRALARALQCRSTIYYDRGEYHKALECLATMEEIMRELGDMRNIAVAIGTRGIIHARRGEEEKALECFTRCEEIARLLDDHSLLAAIVGNRGTVHSARGEYDQALACHTEQERLARALCDREIIATAVGSQGLVYNYCGDYDRALACYREQERIARDIGRRRDVGISVGNQGSLHNARGEYAETLRCYRDAIAEHRALHFRYGLTWWLEGTAAVLLTLINNGKDMPEYLPEYLVDVIPAVTPALWRPQALAAAQRYAEESLSISRDISKPDTLLTSQILLARIAAARGDIASAQRQLTLLLPDAHDNEQRAEIHYRLALLPPTEQGEGTGEDHAAEALRLYLLLHEANPNQIHQQRIEELQSIKTVTDTAHGRDSD